MSCPIAGRSLVSIRPDGHAFLGNFPSSVWHTMHSQRAKLKKFTWGPCLFGPAYPGFLWSHLHGSRAVEYMPFLLDTGILPYFCWPSPQKPEDMCFAPPLLDIPYWHGKLFCPRVSSEGGLKLTIYMYVWNFFLKSIRLSPGGGLRLIYVCFFFESIRLSPEGSLMLWGGGILSLRSARKFFFFFFFWVYAFSPEEALGYETAPFPHLRRICMYVCTAWWQKNSYPTKQKLIQKLIQGYEFFCHQAVLYECMNVCMHTLCMYSHMWLTAGVCSIMSWAWVCWSQLACLIHLLINSICRVARIVLIQTERYCM